MFIGVGVALAPYVTPPSRSMCCLAVQVSQCSYEVRGESSDVDEDNDCDGKLRSKDTTSAYLIFGSLVCNDFSE